jgi:hypothetical protein
VLRGDFGGGQDNVPAEYGPPPAHEDVEVMLLVLAAERLDAELGGGRSDAGPIPSEVTHVLDLWAEEESAYRCPDRRRSMRQLLAEIDIGRMEDDLPAPPEKDLPDAAD